LSFFLEIKLIIWYNKSTKGKLVVSLSFIGTCKPIYQKWQGIKFVGTCKPIYQKWQGIKFVGTCRPIYQK